ncbi:MAG TPA: hypothetical protein VFG09_05695 [Thermodesulfovibrionales bacterium]|nr:hypothetical protein [Thermodesulfovibrionales bacterium]
MERRVPVSLSLLFLTVLGLLSPSFAVMKAMTTEDLAKQSEIVVSGEVEALSSHWTGDGKSIFTRAVVLVNEVIKGRSLQKRIVVEYPGGETGDIGLRVSDVAPLRKKEKVLLFLRSGAGRNGGTVYTTVGKGQGKYSVDENRIARKTGFSVIDGRDTIDYVIPVDALIEKIKRVKE